MRIVAPIILAFILAACSTTDTPQASEVYLYNGCAWGQEKLPVTVAGKKYALNFRSQKCSDPYLISSYKMKGNNLAITRLQALPNGEEKMDGVIATFWDYDPETFKKKIADLNAPSLQNHEIEQCEVIYDEVEDVYTYEPKEHYMDVMLKRNEPFSACGDYGFNNDKESYFKIIDGKLLAFFDLGQEAPLFDVSSFHVTPQ